MHLLFFFQRPDSADDDLPIFVQPNIVSSEEGFAFNILSSIDMFSLLDYSALIIGIGRGHTLLNFNTLLNGIKFSGLSGL